MGQTLLRATRIGLVFAMLLCLVSASWAATTGKVSGTVMDKSTKEPLPAASVRIEGTTMGAMANEKGVYFILNIPPGTYNVTANVIGYAPVSVQGVKINADFTTFQNFELESTVLEVRETITVTAERPLVEKSLTASRTIVEGAELKTLPVVNISEVILTTAGSLGGNLRGGRAQDQQTTLDGATITSQNSNTSQAFTVNPYMIQELEVKTGTYNAEYVNSLSGITSVVTKEGGSKFTGNVEFRTLGQKGLNHFGAPNLDVVDRFRSGEIPAADVLDLIRSATEITNKFNDPGKDEDGDGVIEANEKWRPGKNTRIDGLNLQFPFDVAFDTTGLPDNWKAVYSRDNVYWEYDRIIPEDQGIGFSYLDSQASAPASRRYNVNKYNKYRRHNRTEKRPTQLDWGVGGPLGKKINWFASGRFGESWGRFPNEYGRVINFFGKATIRPSTSTKLNVSGLIEDTGFFSKKGQTGFSWGWKYNLAGLHQSFGGRIHVNAAFSHSLSSKTFYEFRLSHLREYSEYYQPKYGKAPLVKESLAASLFGYNPKETSGAGLVTGYRLFGDAAYERGEGSNFGINNPFQTDLNFTITSQVTPNHQLKAGVGFTTYDYLHRTRGIAEGSAPVLFGRQNEQGVAANVVTWTGNEAHAYPYEVAVFAQDRVEYGGLIVNAGLRLDIFDANANAIHPFLPRPGAGAPGYADDPNYRTIQPSIKTAISPRLGLSHPITDKAALHYSYGIFNQRPPLSELYASLVTSFTFERSHGNPDLPFQKSTNYEMGVQAEVYPGYFLDVTGYFRDVDKLPRSWEMYGPALFAGVGQREINILLPTDAQDARGLEISARRQLANRFSIRANYTLAFANDLNSPGRALLTTKEQFDSGVPKYSSYIRRATGFDRRHRVVANVLVEIPYGVSASFLTKAQSGNEFRTKAQNESDPFGLLGKVRRAPWTTTTDLYAQKVFSVGKNRIGVFTDIRNLFNKKNIYSIPSGGSGAERWIRRKDPVGYLGEPLGGIGTQGNTPRDVFVGVNLAW